MSQPTIVQLLDFIPNSWRSMEQLLVGLAGRMQQEGWRTIHVFTGEPSDRMREALLEVGSSYLVVGDPMTAADAQRIIPLLRAESPALIQTHFLSVFNPLLRRIKKGAGARKLVVTDHSSGLASRKSPPKEALAWLRGRYAASYIDQVIGVSEFVCKRDIEGIHMPAQKVACIHNGVDVRRYVPAAERPAGDAPFTVGFIGYQVPQKGLGTLLDAMAQLAGQGRDFRLVIAGEGPHAAAFQAQASRLGLGERTRFLGQVSDTAGFYQQLDVLVVPSEWEEAFGFVVAEAAACGVCVVTSDVGGIPEIVGRNGEGGLVFARGRKDELASLLVGLMDDPAARQALGQRARDRMVQRFSIDVTVDAYARTLMGLLR